MVAYGHVSLIDIPHLVINPLGEIPKPHSSKMRLIVDMRHVNLWIDVPKFVFEGLHNSKDLLSQGDYMISYDLTYGFNHTELHPLATKVVGFQWRKKLYIYNVLPFGLQSTPYAFAKIVLVLVVRWRRNGIRVLPYLDDFIFSRYM
jgi:hypothetical protein